ncbi:hypothetical protein DIE03_29615 [Burkholderia sp. Bp8992]|nr:hypothetical protein DIE03_29615 [Burkholderia sp. Bp8992]
MRAVAAIPRVRRLPDFARAMQAHASFPGRFGSAVAPAATCLLPTFRPTNSADRRDDRRRLEPVTLVSRTSAGPSGGPLKPAHPARSHLKRVFRRDVKVPATNEATNNPAGRARHSARGRHALASPCRTP